MTALVFPRVAQTATVTSGRPPVVTPTLAWAALFLNVLTFTSVPTIIPIPGTIGQLITQGSLVAGLLFALLANNRGVIRPNLFVILLTVLGVVALITSIHNEFMLGSTFRACRSLAFLGALWLLSRWNGSQRLELVRAHLFCLRIVIGSVLVGAVLSPGNAFYYDGRLSGAIWPIPATQVAHYAAVLLGCSTVLWFTGRLRGRTMLLTLLAAGAALVGTHTRTALLALVMGVVLAGASLFLGHARVRRTAAAILAVGVIAGTFFTPLMLTWLSRGQTPQEATQLSGRTKVWSAIAKMQRPPLESVFGSGLSNKSFGGLPIDSNWLGTYLDQGWFGTAVDVAIILLLLLLAILQRRGVRRALALFFLTYCVVASFTETGFADASPYLLELFLAASLLASPLDEATLSGVRP